MFPTTEIGQKVTREDFDRVADKLRLQLLSLQNELRSADFPVLLMFAGPAIAGKTEALNMINEWLDPRWTVTRAYGPPSDEERERPEYWRYWRDLPPKGQIGLFLGSWYHQPVQDFVYKKSDLATFKSALARIAAFERMLADDGALILKVWLHLDQRTQRKRMKEIEKDRSQSWRIGKQDWEHFKHNKEFEGANEIAIQRTDTSQARWIVLDASNERYRALSILTTIRDALASQLKTRRARAKEIARAARTIKATKASPVAGKEGRVFSTKGALTKDGETRTATVTNDGALRPVSILDNLDMRLTLSDEQYKAALLERRAELGELCRKLHFSGQSALVLFEGTDAAGKGGAIRRLTAAMDARDYRVIPIAAPTDEERAQHYLWRFWRHLPRAGRMTLFDRTWYGRVLVERVEGFAQTSEWQRSYSEINEFEEQLADRGVILVKFWLHVTKEEQARRFKEREKIAYKAWKLTDEDWRNRAKWDDYLTAVHEMVERTSTQAAHWTLTVSGSPDSVIVSWLQSNW